MITHAVINNIFSTSEGPQSTSDLANLVEPSFGSQRMGQFQKNAPGESVSDDGPAL